MGIVSYSKDHYTSFIKRSKGWGIHNDLVKKNKRASLQAKIIKPHTVMYVKN